MGYDTPDGFVLTGNDTVLITSRGKIRTFTKLDSVHSMIKGLGCARYTVSTEAVDF